MRVFFDTNVLVSALTTRGLCVELHDRVLLSHDLILGEPVVEELLPILADKLKVPPAGLLGGRTVVRGPCWLGTEQGPQYGTHSG